LYSNFDLSDDSFTELCNDSGLAPKRLISIPISIRCPPKHAHETLTELLASVSQLLFANLWAASTALATLYRTLCGQCDHLSEVVFDFAEAKVAPLELSVEI
jgi:hypothetical protein